MLAMIKKIKKIWALIICLSILGTANVIFGAAGDLVVSPGKVEDGCLGIDMSLWTYGIPMIHDGSTTRLSFLDQDSMSSDDATGLASQQSIKAYVADQIDRSQYLAVFNPVNYSGTDTAKIQSAVNAAVADKGIVYIPYKSGSWNVIDEAPADNHCILISGSCTIIGDGQHQTYVRTNDNNADIFYINTASAVDISRMTIENTSGTATTGANGITATAASANNEYSTFENLILKNNDIGISLLNATNNSIIDSIFYSTYTYGILINNTYTVDSGSHFINGNIFHGAVTAQLRIESGGGSRIIGNNFLEGDYGLDLGVRDGTVTSVLIVDANKFETQDTNSIRIGNYSGGTTGVYEKIIISDNEFCEDCTGGTSTGLAIDGHDDDTIRTLAITGNVMHGGGIDIGDCTHVLIANNVIEKQTVSRTYGINFTAAPTGDISVFGNAIYGFTNKVGGTAVQSQFGVNGSGDAGIYSNAGSGSDAYIILCEAGVNKAYLKWDGTDLLINTNAGDIKLNPNGGDVIITGAVAGNTLDTGQGANELYDMDQNVLTTSSPSFVNPLSTSYYKAQGVTPGFWLDETGAGNKDAFCVLDGKIFQIQRRAQGFGAYESTPYYLNLTAPSYAIHVDEVGHIGFGKDPTTKALDMNIGGGYCTTGGVWTNGSSKEYKTNIRELDIEDASNVLDNLVPVRYNPKSEIAVEYLGFIAEDVPDLVASSDRKGMSPMNIIAILTKIVQQQQTRLKRIEDFIGINWN